MVVSDSVVSRAKSRSFASLRMTTRKTETETETETEAEAEAVGGD
jgi:hypothetical protein